MFCKKKKIILPNLDTLMPLCTRWIVILSLGVNPMMVLLYLQKYVTKIWQFNLHNLILLFAREYLLQRYLLCSDNSFNIIPTYYKNVINFSSNKKNYFTQDKFLLQKKYFLTKCIGTRICTVRNLQKTWDMYCIKDPL